jgi:uncharacterized protein YegP (UPF0339 family)
MHDSKNRNKGACIMNSYDFLKGKSNEVIVPQEPNQPVEDSIKESEIDVYKRYAGKYEVYPEAGLIKYRLKASNGEILVVSAGYVSRSGAKSGIQTFKKNVDIANFKLIMDKNNYSQFQLYTPNGGRLIANGEYYDSMNGALSAMESVKKFYDTNKIVDLDEIPKDEIREEIVVSHPVEKLPNGKIEVYSDDKQWKAALKASNGQILFVTSGYASKIGLLKGIETIQKEIDHDTFRVSKDKQDRYQFKLYSTNNQQLLVGETYGNKSDAFSAVDSVRRFASDAKVIFI